MEVTPGSPAELPEATQEGKGTFGCMVNGKVMTTRAVSVTLWDRRYFILEAKPHTASSHSARSDYSFLLELIDDPISEGTYHLSDSSAAAEINKHVAWLCSDECKSPPDEAYLGKGYARLTDTATDCEYYTDGIIGKGFLNITFLDHSQRIISGTFNFFVDTPDCRGREITNGRFDVKYSIGISPW